MTKMFSGQNAPAKNDWNVSAKKSRKVKSVYPSFVQKLGVYGTIWVQEKIYKN